MRWILREFGDKYALNMEDLLRGREVAGHQWRGALAKSLPFNDGFLS